MTRSVERFNTTAPRRSLTDTSPPRVSLCGIRPMVPPVKKICCIGAGYVGGPTCAVLAAKNPELQVTVVDLSQSRINAWNSSQLPIWEPGLQEILKEARDGAEGREPNLFFSTNVELAIEEAQIIFIAVNTPTKTVGVGAGKAFDLTYVESAARLIAEVSTANKIVIEKSTVPCGTAQNLRKIFQELGKPGVSFEVLSNPEFLAEGTAIKDLVDPNRILLGSLRTANGIAAAKILTDIYSSWVPRERIIDVTVGSSELAKLAANCMLAQRISSINSLSCMCENEDADIGELAQAIGMDNRIGSKFLKASVGFGGSCFKKDVLSLVYMAEARHLPEVAAYWRGVVEINEYQKVRFANRILSSLNNTMTDKSIAVLGYSYKKNTGDARESAAITVVGQLFAENARVLIYDPKVSADQIRKDFICEYSEEVLDQRLAVCRDAYDACSNVAAVVILTEWDEFKTDHLSSPSISSKQGDEGTGPYRNIESIKWVESDSSLASEDSASDSPAASRRVDWARIASIVRRPRLIFDGRNIVDPKKLEALGFQVHRIGS